MLKIMLLNHFWTQRDKVSNIRWKLIITFLLLQSVCVIGSLINGLTIKSDIISYNLCIVDWIMVLLVILVNYIFNKLDKDLKMMNDEFISNIDFIKEENNETL